MSKHFTREPLKEGAPATAVRAGGGGGELGAMATSLGNAEMQDRLESLSADRDEMMQFIQLRLEQIRGAQRVEMEQVDNPNRWYREVNLRQDTAPHPARWHAAATLYREAARDLAMGHIGLAARRLEAALEAERAAWESLPDHVDARLSRRRSAPDALPASAGRINDEATCAPTRIPMWLQLADQIIELDPEVRVPRLLQIPRGGWWSDAKDEDEGEGEGD